jgi:hypothetical protein
MLAAISGMMEKRREAQLSERLALTSSKARDLALQLLVISQQGSRRRPHPVLQPDRICFSMTLPGSTSQAAGANQL